MVEAPLAIVDGIAVRVTVGGDGGRTVTFTDCVESPPAPVQVNAKAEFAVRAPVVAVPDGALVPLQLPDAVQDVALVDDQVRTPEDPDMTDDGVTVSVTVGASGAGGGCVTLARTVCPAEPPAPEQLKEYEVEAESVPVDSVPAKLLEPLQPPDATQSDALVDDQVRLAEPDFWTVSGATVSETAGGGGTTAAGAAELEDAPPPQPTRSAATSDAAPRSSEGIEIRIKSWARNTRNRPAKSRPSSTDTPPEAMLPASKGRTHRLGHHWLPRVR